MPWQGDPKRLARERELLAVLALLETRIAELAGAGDHPVNGVSNPHLTALYGCHGQPCW